MKMNPIPSEMNRIVADSSVAFFRWQQASSSPASHRLSPKQKKTPIMEAAEDPKPKLPKLRTSSARRKVQDTLKQKRAWRDNIFVQSKLREENASLERKVYRSEHYEYTEATLSPRYSALDRYAGKMNKGRGEAKTSEKPQESILRILHAKRREILATYELLGYSVVLDAETGLDRLGFSRILRDTLEIKDPREVLVLRRMVFPKSKCLDRDGLFKFLLPLLAHYCLFTKVVDHRHASVRPCQEQLRLLMCTLSIIESTHSLDNETFAKNINDHGSRAPTVLRALHEPSPEELRIMQVCGWHVFQHVVHFCRLPSHPHHFAGHCRS